MYYHMNSPGALNMKVGETLASTILAASTVQESRLGTTSGKAYYSPNVRVDGLGATSSLLGLLPGVVSTKRCWTFFLRKIPCAVRNYYWSERFIARNKTEEPSDEPPTDQEQGPGDRADQAHRAQLITRSIISFGCLSLVKSVFVFVYYFFEQLYSKLVVYSCDSSLQPALHWTEWKILLAQATFICEYTSMIRSPNQNFCFFKHRKKRNNFSCTLSCRWGCHRLLILIVH